jgi:hypothetical protein
MYSTALHATHAALLTAYKIADCCSYYTCLAVMLLTRAFSLLILQRNKVPIQQRLGGRPAGGRGGQKTVTLTLPPDSHFAFNILTVTVQ